MPFRTPTCRALLLEAKEYILYQISRCLLPSSTVGQFSIANSAFTRSYSAGLAFQTCNQLEGCSQRGSACIYSTPPLHLLSPAFMSALLATARMTGLDECVLLSVQNTHNYESATTTAPRAPHCILCSSRYDIDHMIFSSFVASSRIPARCPKRISLQLHPLFFFLHH